MKRLTIPVLILVGLMALLTACGGKTAGPNGANAPKEIKVDYAYYSPLSLLIKQKGWMEEEFKSDSIEVKWVLSLGSNKALEYLSTGGVDFGSAAGAAALLSKANGNAIKAVYVFSKPEWTALVVGKNSTVTSVKELKGKKIAATKGTDPYIFLLRILHDAGLTKNDVEIVHLQHPDGRTALEKGDVVAWAGLDPHMASSELEQGSKLVVRKADYNTYGFLNTTESFAKSYPEHTKRVLKVYEKARQWALQNPAELVKIVAAEAKITQEVAQKVVGERNDFSDPVPGSKHIAGLQAASQVLVDEQLIKADANVQQVITNLIDDSFAKAVVGH